RQLPVAELALGNTLQVGAVQVVRFYAALRRCTAVDEPAKDLALYAHHPLILTDRDAEFDRLPVRIPARIFRKREEHTPPPGVAIRTIRFLYCSQIACKCRLCWLEGRPGNKQAVRQVILAGGEV